MTSYRSEEHQMPREEIRSIVLISEIDDTKLDEFVESVQVQTGADVHIAKAENLIDAVDKFKLALVVSSDAKSLDDEKVI